mgnify:FL=1|jgi:hypothetical protein
MGQDKKVSINNSIDGKILNWEKSYFFELERIFQSQDFSDHLLKMKKWINLSYSNMQSWNKANKVQLPCQRIINYVVMKNLKQIIGVYNSAISSDIAFETSDVIINIDSKTVSSTGNKGDFESLFFGPNQSSFKNKNIGIGMAGKNYPGLPVDFQLPSIDISTNKPVLTYFLMIKYTDNKKNFDWYSNQDEPNIRLICIPNGELSYLFNNDIISNPKTYAYAKTSSSNSKKTDKTYPLSHSFQNAIPIMVYTKKGFYISNTKETWLETEIKQTNSNNKVTVYKQAISSHSCRIDFKTLKDRYDSNQKYWKGVSNWNI